MVAVLWGANIGGVYPIVEIIFGDKDGQTLQAGSTSGSRLSRPQLADRGSRFELGGATSWSPAKRNAGRLKTQLRGLDRRASRQRNRFSQRRQWLRPYIHEYLPHNAFQTIVLIVVVW